MSISPILIPNSPILICGEAPGKTEVEMGRPFVGTSGQELDSMLADAGIDRSSCSLTNVFLDRPPGNDLTKWMTSKKAGGIGVSIEKGKYFPQQYYKERERLYAEIRAVSPNLILALGNTACWALLDRTGISSLRGVCARSPYTNTKVLPTYHPAAILREYSFRLTAIRDLIKAKRESGNTLIRVPDYKIIIEPDLSEVAAGLQRLYHADLVAYDIETAANQITCIGFAMRGFAITIPFSCKEGSYWKTEREEVLVWRMVKNFLEHSKAKKVTQNGLYDIQYLHRYSICPSNSLDDTMLLAHSMMPELPKSLAYIGSIYTDFPSWKWMRGKYESNKKEE